MFGEFCCRILEEARFLDWTGRGISGSRYVGVVGRACCLCSRSGVT